MLSERKTVFLCIRRLSKREFLFCKLFTPYLVHYLLREKLCGYHSLSILRHSQREVPALSRTSSHKIYTIEVKIKDSLHLSVFRETHIRHVIWMELCCCIFRTVPTCLSNNFASLLRRGSHFDIQNPKWREFTISFNKQNKSLTSSTHMSQIESTKPTKCILAPRKVINKQMFSHRLKLLGLSREVVWCNQYRRRNPYTRSQSDIGKTVFKCLGRTDVRARTN